MYYPRLIDKALAEWKLTPVRKPLLIRGARQVGKSSAIRHLGETFSKFVEINFEKEPKLRELFRSDLSVERIVSQLSAIKGLVITPGDTLLFFDEIQACPEAIMSLRFFKEDMPLLHVVGAGSLLEFALAELPTYGVGRIHSLFMYPMTFDEFLVAEGQSLLLEMRNKGMEEMRLSEAVHDRVIDYFRSYLMVGGMPEVVKKWVEQHNYSICQQIQEDILLGYQDDFPKYRKRVDPGALRIVLRSVALQTGSKFTYSEVGGGFSSSEIKKALELLILAGICIPVIRCAGNGVPLGAQAEYNDRKILMLDNGLMLRLLGMENMDVTTAITSILTSTPEELVNRGPLAEMIAGLELLRYSTPNIRHEIFYWQREARNAQAEIDYLTSHANTVYPIEVKSGTRGGMKSLWIFMREKHLTEGIRMSLENFGTFEYIDEKAEGVIRIVSICPLYAVSQLPILLNKRYVK
ncbi:MAG: AAA family ATPase [Muribaculaceae bacterium]|nr:AAA family ATPase [Muribaculaceae bacterium]